MNFLKKALRNNFVQALLILILAPLIIWGLKKGQIPFMEILFKILAVAALFLVLWYALYFLYKECKKGDFKESVAQGFRSLKRLVSKKKASTNTEHHKDDDPPSSGSASTSARTVSTSSSTSSHSTTKEFRLKFTLYFKEFGAFVWKYKVPIWLSISIVQFGIGIMLGYIDLFWLLSTILATITTFELWGWVGKNSIKAIKWLWGKKWGQWTLFTLSGFLITLLWLAFGELSDHERLNNFMRTLFFLAIPAYMGMGLWIMVTKNK